MCVCVNLNFFFIICHIDNTDADKFCGLVGELRTVNLLCCLRNVQCFFVDVCVCVCVGGELGGKRSSKRAKQLSAKHRPMEYEL